MSSDIYRGSFRGLGRSPQQFRARGFRSRSRSRSPARASYERRSFDGPLTGAFDPRDNCYRPRYSPPPSRRVPRARADDSRGSSSSPYINLGNKLNTDQQAQSPAPATESETALNPTTGSSSSPYLNSGNKVSTDRQVQSLTPLSEIETATQVSSVKMTEEDKTARVKDLAGVLNELIQHSIELATLDSRRANAETLLKKRTAEFQKHKLHHEEYPPIKEGQTRAVNEAEAKLKKIAQELAQEKSKSLKTAESIAAFSLSDRGSEDDPQLKSVIARCEALDKTCSELRNELDEQQKDSEKRLADQQKKFENMLLDQQKLLNSIAKQQNGLESKFAEQHKTVRELDSQQSHCDQQLGSTLKYINDDEDRQKLLQTRVTTLERINLNSATKFESVQSMLTKHDSYLAEQQSQLNTLPSFKAELKSIWEKLVALQSQSPAPGITEKVDLITAKVQEQVSSIKDVQALETRLEEVEKLGETVKSLTSLETQVAKTTVQTNVSRDNLLSMETRLKTLENKSTRIGDSLPTSLQPAAAQHSLSGTADIVDNLFKLNEDLEGRTENIEADVEAIKQSVAAIANNVKGSSKTTSPNGTLPNKQSGLDESTVLTQPETLREAEKTRATPGGTVPQHDDRWKDLDTILSNLKKETDQLQLQYNGVSNLPMSLQSLGGRFDTLTNRVEEVVRELSSSKTAQQNENAQLKNFIEGIEHAIVNIDARLNNIGTSDLAKHMISQLENNQPHTRIMQDTVQEVQIMKGGVEFLHRQSRQNVENIEALQRQVGSIPAVNPNLEQSHSELRAEVQTLQRRVDTVPPRDQDELTKMVQALENRVDTSGEKLEQYVADKLISYGEISQMELESFKKYLADEMEISEDSIMERMRPIFAMYGEWKGESFNSARVNKVPQTPNGSRELFGRVAHNPNRQPSLVRDSPARNRGTPSSRRSSTLPTDKKRMISGENGATLPKSNGKFHSPPKKRKRFDSIDPDKSDSGDGDYSLEDELTEDVLKNP